MTVKRPYLLRTKAMSRLSEMCLHLLDQPAAARFLSRAASAPVSGWQEMTIVPMALKRVTLEFRLGQF